MKKVYTFATFFSRRIAWLLMCVSTLVFSSCSDEYDDSELRADIEDLENRVAALEAWQKSVNSDIQSLQSLVKALEEKNFITDVTPVKENGIEVGYTITFQTGESITIKHGVDGIDGETPVIGVAKDTDGVYYWTVKIGDAAAEFMTDGAGNKIPVTGPKGDTGDDGQTPYIGENGNWWIGTTDTGVKAQGDTGDDGQTPYIKDGNWWIGTTDTGVKAQGEDAIAPQVRINADSNEWEISTDGGATWTSTGVKATGEKGEDGEKGDRGDAVFAENGVDYTSDPDNVIFTLADGTQLVIPRANTLTVGFDSYEPFTVYAKGSDVAIVLPQGLKESDYTAMVAEVKNEAGTGMDIQTRAASPWQVDLTKPAFVDGVYQNNAKVRVTPVDAANGDKAILKVTLIDKEGQEVSVSRVLQYYENALTFAAMEGGSFTLEEDLVLKEPVIVPAGKTLDLDLGGHTIASDDTWDGNVNWSVVSVLGGNLTIKNGTVQSWGNGVYGMDVRNGGHVVIESGTYLGYLDAVYVHTGTVEIKGGTFDLVKTEEYPDWGTNYLINCLDANYKNGTAKVIITGGTFVDFDPANNRAEGVGTNFVAAGYSSEKVSDNPATYEVVPGVKVDSADDIQNAIASAVESGSNTVVLTAPVSFNEDIELDGQGVMFEGSPVYFNGSSVTVKNLTFANGHNASKNGSAVYVTGGNCKNLTFENCTFVDAEWDAVQLTNKDIESVAFRNCTFKNTMQGYRYIHLELVDSNALAVNETATVEITGCTFENVSNAYCKDSAITITGFLFANMKIAGNYVKGAGADHLTTSVIWICDGNNFSNLMSEEDINQASTLVE